MAIAQFEKDYRSLLRRFRRPADVETVRVFNRLDRLARQLQRKDLPDAERDSSKKKLSDNVKKLRQAIKDEAAEIKRDGVELAKTLPDPGARSAAGRGMRSLLDGVTKLEKTAAAYCKTHGAPTPPPPRMPSTDFAADYARAIAKFAFKQTPAVFAALKKLDSAQKSEEVAPLCKAAKTELDKSLSPLGTESRGGDPKSKANALGALAELAKIREEMKGYDQRVFLLHRMKG